MKHLLPLFFWAMAAIAAAQTPTSIEAVEYDPAGRWLVTNGANILQTADAGTTWSVFGSVGATHGMEVVDGHLYALQNGILRAVDLESEVQTSSLSIPGASFLNGMGSHSGELVISDFGTGALHRVDITDPAAMTSSVLVSNLGATPNGVVIDEANNRALVVTWGVCKIYAVDLTTAEVSTVVASTGLSNCDGIDLDAAGQAYVSSWSPNRITRYSADFSSSEAVVTSGLNSPADISYATDLDTLAVANSGSDVVTFHGFAPAVGLAERPQSNHDVIATSTGLMATNLPTGSWIVLGYDLSGRVLWQSTFQGADGRQEVDLMSRAGGRWEATWTMTLEGPAGQRFAVKRGLRQP